MKTWTLTSCEQGVYLESLAIGPADVPGTPPDWSVRKRRLRGGKQDGVDLVEINNGRMRIFVLPTRGMGIWRAQVGDQTLGWNSPVKGPIHPQFVPLAEDSGLGWLDGFDELLARCGLASNGAPEFDERGTVKYPLHGRIANLPAHQVTLRVVPGKGPGQGEIRITGVVDETRFHIQQLRLTTTLTTKFGEASFTIRDEVQNLSARPAEAQLLYHVNFGAPLLDAGAKMVAPVKTLVPRNDHAAAGLKNYDSYPAEQPDSEEQVYFFDLLADKQGQTQTLLRNAHGTQGVSLHFNHEQLPCFSQWKNPAAAADGYVTGLEPGTNYPNPRSFEGEQGRVVKLPPGGSQIFDLRIDWHLESAEVAAAEKQIAKLAAGHTPTIHNKPQPGWCA